VSYAGAFRLPAAGATGDDFSYGGTPIAYNPAANSLFVGSRRGSLAEVTIPAPVKSTELRDLPVAGYLQAFADPTEGQRTQISPTDVVLGGLLVFGGRLYGTGSIYYDATNEQTASHYTRSLNLSMSSFKGMYTLAERGKTGFVAGYLAAVPPEWQLPLGGAAITGQCCVPIISRTSWGPAAFAWNPDRLGMGNPLLAIPLVYYTEDHATLGTWSASGERFGATTQLGGAAFIAGTRTALFVGLNGTGSFCYGNGTNNEALAGSHGSDGARYCYDPTNSYKGAHAYPYRYQLWAYDLNDFASVKAGRKKPWDVLPYAVWPFTLPFGGYPTPIGGVGYDALRQLVYISQLRADQDGYAFRPIIHVFHIR
jgi:hypothetical protein